MEAALAEAAKVQDMDERRERMMSVEQAEGIAAAEGLRLVHDPRLSCSFRGVKLLKRCKLLPYTAVAHRNKERIHLGAFSSAAEAALAYSRFLGPMQSCRQAQQVMQVCDVSDQVHAQEIVSNR